jgi:amino acid transporter
LVILLVELSAAALLLDYWSWSDKVNVSVWVTMCLVVAVTINMLGAGAYGESEFIFACVPCTYLHFMFKITTIRSIKVITITGLIILGIVIDLGGGPNRDRIGFRYWKNPGPFVQYAMIIGAEGRFLGWWSVMSNAAFSFIGTEIVAV